MAYRILTAEEAASYINHDDNVGFGGFTAAGTPKATTIALAKRAKAEHDAGRPFKIGLYTGASTNDYIDGELSRVNAIKTRTPYQSHPDSRNLINSGEMPYYDLHLSHLSQYLRYGYMGKMHVGIIEAADVSEDGEILLGAGVGMAPTVCELCDKLIIERNHHESDRMRGMHDIYTPLDPPYRREIPIYKPSDRIGSPVIKVDPKKIIGIVETDLTDGVKPFSPVDAITSKIGENVCNFLAGQLKSGLLPKEFLPVQSGVGNIANAVLGQMGLNPDIPQFQMYTEVVQDSAMELMFQGKCTFASTCGMTVSDDMLSRIMDNIYYFKDRVILRPSEITNHPEIVRRLGLITMNTALEADIFGNVNSTHVTGTKMMNGLGGSADFTRNAYLSIFACPSVAKGGKISSIVPMVSHQDHSEHSVMVIATEHGVADLRAKSPRQRAEAIIENCAHPMYRELLWDYLKMSKGGHTPHTLKAAFAFHTEFLDSGDMTKTDFSKYR